MSASVTGAIDIPLTITELDGLTRQHEPVATGVPLPQGMLTDPGTLALIGPEGEPVAADFASLAQWGDDSVKWLVVDFLADVEGNQAATYRLTDQVKAGAPSKALYIDNDTNELTVDTGVLRFILNKHGFDGFAKAWMNLDGEKRIGYTSPVIVGQRDGGGLVAVGQDGKVYSSQFGRIETMEVERQGKLHGAICVRGDLRSRDGDVLLDYALRLYVSMGSSRVRMVCTVHNPGEAGRINGDRWVLGQAGSVLFKSLDFVLPVETQGLRRVTLSPETGTMWDRIPDPQTMTIYQDSSGGENWFSRAHVNGDNRIPLQFKGYKAWYGQTEIGSGDRAEPWIDLSDMTWGVAVGMPAFWQNFPKALGVEGSDIRIGLWPRQYDDLHEIQGGEQKTHEWTVYFHHRREVKPYGVMPYERDVMATVRRPLRAWAPAQWYSDSGVFDPHAPYDPNRFQDYEASIQGGVTAKPRNLMVDREIADEYGWRNYGDTWAANERDKTKGPHDGLDVVNHYNHEYDHGYWMLVNCLRTLDVGTDLWPTWWELASSGLWHEADIDLYHSTQGVVKIYNGGKFTHGAHGVDVGRATHRGSPRDGMWGQLDWGWQRGSSPEAGHFNTRGMIYLYLITGDKHLLDAAWDLAELVAWKIENKTFAQIDDPSRNAGHNLQVLTDAYIMTHDERWLRAADEMILACHADKVIKGNRRFDAGWSNAIYLQALARYIELHQVELGQTPKVALDSLQGYTKLMLDQRFDENGAKFGYEGAWAGRYTDAMMVGYTFEPDPALKQRYLNAAKAAFEAYPARRGEAGIYNNSKTHTIRAGGGGRYIHHATTNK